MQSDEYFKQSDWMSDPVDDNLTNAILDSFGQYNDIFRLTRNDLLAEPTSVLINSQEFHDDNCLGFIDSLIQKNARRECQHMLKVQERSSDIDALVLQRKTREVRIVRR